MGFNYRRFIDLLFFPLYDLHSKVTIYFRNRQVKTGFRKDPSTKHFLLVSVVLLGFALSFLLFWALIRRIPSAEKTENVLIQLPAENQQEILEQGSITATVIETDKEIPQIIDSFTVIKNKKGNVTENEEVEVKTEAALKEKKKEDEVDVVAYGVADDVVADAVSNAVAITSHYIRVRANNVNIRTKPSLESEIIARLGQGHIAKKLDRQGDWVLTDAGRNIKGWVYYDLLEDTTADEHESWKNNPKRYSAIEMIRNDLEDPNNLEIEKKKIEELLSSWKAAWEEKDIDKYMSFYSKAFTKATFNWESYKEYKKNIFDNPAIISVEIINVRISWDNFFMIASFIQKYQSGSINSTITKMLHFQQKTDGWKIVKESLINRDA